MSPTHLSLLIPLVCALLAYLFVLVNPHQNQTTAPRMVAFALNYATMQVPTLIVAALFGGTTWFWPMLASIGTVTVVFIAIALANMYCKYIQPNLESDSRKILDIVALLVLLSLTTAAVITPIALFW